MSRTPGLATPRQVTAPPAIPRVIAGGLIVLIGVMTLSFLAVTASGKVLMIAGIIGFGGLCGWLRGREFFRVRLPIPEILVVLSWLGALVGAGYLWPSLPGTGGIVFLLLSPFVCCGAIVWASVRALISPTLQSLGAVLVGFPSLVFFVAVISRL